MKKRSKMSAEYKAYLQSSQWKSIRESILKRDKGRCVKCNSSKQLNIHHLHYKNIFHEKEDDLITLCEACHRKEHKKPKKKSNAKKIMKEGDKCRHCSFPVIKIINRKPSYDKQKIYYPYYLFCATCNLIYHPFKARKFIKQKDLRKIISTK
jgi:phage terminase large subunit GpA-like protein